MAEINTFSAAVDTVIARSHRPDKKSDAISFIRATVRELESKAFFEESRIEQQITCITTDPHVFPLPQFWRTAEFAEYTHILDPHSKPVVPKWTRPGPGTQNLDHFAYQVGETLVFTGLGLTGGLTGTINLAYHAFLPPLRYFDLTVSGTVRPATFSDETLTWTYDPVTVDPDEQAAAEALVTNWIIFRWYETILEGALAKLYKTLEDTRAPTSFALYKSYEQDFVRTAPMIARNA
ncbi:MAG: hypothetical protein ACR2O4_06495 [Hyphomicrobiaceae bacterium]